MVQKKFYGGFESRKLSFFNMQMGEGLFSWHLEEPQRKEGCQFTIITLGRMQTVEGPLVIPSQSPHRQLPLPFKEHSFSSDTIEILPPHTHLQQKLCNITSVAKDCRVDFMKQGLYAPQMEFY